MFYFFSKILDILLSPLSWALILIVWGAPLSRRALRRGRARPKAIVLGLLTLVFFSMEPVANFLWSSLEADAVSTMDPKKHYDVVILLGGLVDERAMEKSNGSLAINDNNERMLGTLDVMREGRADFAMVSGAAVDPKSPYGEAKVVTDELATLGVPRDRLIVEGKAMNTRENATYSAEIVKARGFKKVLIVTSAFHMRRAAACYKKTGMDFDTLAVDYRTYDPARVSGSWLPRSTHLDHSTAAIREWTGYYIYKARGYID